MWDLVHLAINLKSQTPRGKKDGKWMWAESPIMIKVRLESFLKRFPEMQDKYTEEDVLNAYDRYLKDTTNPDGTINSYRRLLKYFIFKEGEETKSDLVNYLELKEELDVTTTTSSTATWNDVLL